MDILSAIVLLAVVSVFVFIAYDAYSSKIKAALYL